ncbi:MAG: nitroreductase family deazaflavin-dependent oxidoreductase [Ktedonobacteraceae bacterium]|nr:nitroreductase family deazaflavin-dependent oxidoreductase [Ktedonobacteraceae bacterium]
MNTNDEELAQPAKTLNQQIIDDFHAHGGKVGHFPGATFLLLHTHGAKSNQPRITPLLYFKDGDKYVLVVAKGGALSNPDWYYNMLAHPDEVTIEVGTEQFNVHATVAEPAERDRLFADVVRQAPDFAESQKGTPRIMPIVLLECVNERH